MKPALLLLLALPLSAQVISVAAQEQLCANGDIDVCKALVLMRELKAQAPTKPVETPARPASTTNTGNFYAGGINFLPQSSPKPSVWGAIAIQTSKTTPLWQINETDINYVSSTKTLQSSVRAGMATRCSVAEWSLFCWGAAGVATTGSTTTGAYSGGLIWLHPVTAGSKLNVVVAARALKTAATGPQFLLSVGLGSGGVK
jgi:hypothetical protein